MNSPDLAPETPNDAVESAAAEWLVLHDRGLTATQQDAFLQWLAASPAHREAYERHRRMWRDFDALAQWRPEHGAEPNPDLLAVPRRRQPLLRRFAPVLLATAAMLVLTFWLTRASSTDDTLIFETAAYRQEKLSDGSVLDLNRGAHVVVQFTSAERRVLLVQGEAQFTVAKNPARPFIVRAGVVDVRAVGTAFNVKLAGANLEVLVTEGKVSVAPQPVAPRSERPTTTSPMEAPAPVVLAALTAGQRTVIPMAAVLAPPEVVTASGPEIERLLEWRPTLFDFDSTPLPAVVEAFNRRNAVQLIIADESLRSLPIVASIRSDNVEGFVRLLEATMGVRAERSSVGIVLRRAR